MDFNNYLNKLNEKPTIVKTSNRKRKLKKKLIPLKSIPNAYLKKIKDKNQYSHGVYRYNYRYLVSFITAELNTNLDVLNYINNNTFHSLTFFKTRLILEFNSPKAVIIVKFEDNNKIATKIIDHEGNILLDQINTLDDSNFIEDVEE